ncbi:hypothetical protein NKJ55_34435 [Mesorhizobium sp. M0106]
MATRAELVAAIGGRFRGRTEKPLDEFVALTCFHRKDAMRLLRRDCAPAKSGPRPGRRAYGDEVRAALVVGLGGIDRICGKRLHPLLPSPIEPMERHGHGAMDSETRQQLLTISQRRLIAFSRTLGECQRAAAAEGINDHPA